MNTVDKIVNDIAQKLANAIVEASNYKVLYEAVSYTHLTLPTIYSV